MSPDYNKLLNENYLIGFLNSIADFDTNPTIKTAAKNLAFAISGDKIIPNYFYYNELYKKYKIKLLNVNSSEGLKISLYSLNGDVIKFIGQVNNTTVTSTLNFDILIKTPTINELTSPTYNTLPIISGTADQFVEVTLYNNNVFFGKTTSDAYGNWIYIPPSNLSLGTYVFTAKETKNGKVSLPSTSVPLVIVQEITAPTVTFTSPTYDRTPTITGTAIASSTIDILDGGVSIGTTTANAVTGNWSFTPGTNLSISTHTITATATVLGETSSPSSPQTLEIQLVTAPTVSVTSPTYDRTPTITGTAIASSTIDILDSGSSIGTTTADGSGNWSFTPGTDLSVSTHSITATATLNTQTSSASSPSNLVIQLVTTPTVTFTSPTTDKTPTISGTAIASSTITIYDSNVSQGTTTADGSGNWTFTPGSDWTVATHVITATATISGQTSSTSSPQNLVIELPELLTTVIDEFNTIL